MVNEGNHPQMAELFRLVKYYNLPRYLNVVFIWKLDNIFQNPKTISSVIPQQIHPPNCCHGTKQILGGPRIFLGLWVH